MREGEETRGIKEQQADKKLQAVLNRKREQQPDKLRARLTEKGHQEGQHGLGDHVQAAYDDALQARGRRKGWRMWAGLRADICRLLQRALPPAVQTLAQHSTAQHRAVQHSGAHLPQRRKVSLIVERHTLVGQPSVDTIHGAAQPAAAQPCQHATGAAAGMVRGGGRVAALGTAALRRSAEVDTQPQEALQACG